MNELSHQWGILNEFFSDINVNFPKKPKLTTGIHPGHFPCELQILHPEDCCNIKPAI
jgi:hypothetical protein